MKRKTPERPRERSRRDPTKINLLRILVLALLLLQAFAGFFPGPLLWGVNHLAYTAPIFRIVWLILGVLLVWTSAADSLGRWLTTRVAPLLLGRKLVAYGIAPIIGILFFWLLRCRTYFLGDGWLLGESVAMGIPFHGFDFVHYHLVAKLAGSLTRPTEASAFHMFAVISIAAGVLYLVAAGWSARNVSKDDGERILLYLLFIFCAPVEMFMGYVECYSILLVFMSLFAVAIALHYLGRLPIWAPAAVFGLGLAFHLNALFLAPLLFVLILWPAARTPRSIWKRLAFVATPVVGAMALALAFFLLEGYRRSNFEIDFLKSRQTQRLLVALSGSDGLLSWRHWKDVLNLVLLLVPVPLVMLLSAVTGKKATGAEPQRHGETEATRGRAEETERHGATEIAGPHTTDRYHDNRSTSVKAPRDPGRRAHIALLAGSLWLVLVISLVRMKLGMARDWDLFAAQTPIFVLTAFLIWSRRTRGRPGFRFIGIAAAAAMLLSLPWFFVNASETQSVQRFKDVIGDLPNFSQAYAHDELGKFYRKQGTMREALIEYETAARLFPENARFSTVLGGLQYNTGRRDEALQSFNRALMADSTFALALQMVARIHAERGEFDQALVYARRLAGTPGENSDAAALHGTVAERLGIYDEALRAYQTSAAKNPQRTDLAERIAAVREKMGIEPGQPKIR